MSEKLFHFNNYEKISINDNFNIPTVVYKDKTKEFIGYEALENINSHGINRNFKLDIGRYDPSDFSKNYFLYEFADGQKASAIKLFEIFMGKVLLEAEKTLRTYSSSLPKSIMIAEPLQIQPLNEEENVNSNWLSLYRKNIKKYFEKKGFENISFLPEPFAVFQYYKFVKKFQPLHEKKKFVVLIIDFGGGTFDTCIIETNNNGEISLKGKNSKPVGASSIAKGGSNLDKMILDDLLYRNNKQNDIEIKKAIRFCRDIQKGKKALNSGTEGQRNFYKNYLRSLIQIENTKIILSNRIRDWDLDKEINEGITISLPEDFFSDGTCIRSYRLTVLQFRQIFKSFYESELKKGIRLTLDRGNQQLSEKINYVLLSGGSSKIGWLKNMLQMDFQQELNNSDFIPLDNYKEVVSAGLAVECARRFYNETGDFADTTYNAINLILNPNNRGIEIPKYKSKSPEFKDGISEGTLIPSATILRDHFNKKLAWKFRLRSEPKNILKYYFLRNTLELPNGTDEEEHFQSITSSSRFGEIINCTETRSYSDNLLNLLDNTIEVKTKHFDKYVELELEFKEDGTIYPEFILNSNGNIDSRVKGNPFFIDMTFGDAPIPTTAYLGVDFGTCNSSLSFVNQKDIETYDNKNNNTQNEIIREIISDGAFPLAYTLARFYKEADEEKAVKRYAHFFENILAIVLYSLISELQDKNKNIGFDIDRYMRSAGSIFSSIKILKKDIDHNCTIIPKLIEILDEDFITSLEEGVNIINSTKHSRINLHPLLDKNLGKLLQLYTGYVKNLYMGFFDNITSEPFSNLLIGDFIKAHGSGIFTDKLIYKGNNHFSKQYCFLINPEIGKGLNLFPFVYWDSCSRHVDEDYGHCYFFSLIRKKDGAIVYDSADGLCSKEILPSQREYSNFMDELKKCSVGKGTSKVFDIELLSKCYEAAL